MQKRIDTVNRVLREQITGIRVVRAFVREPIETRAVRARPTRDLTDTALRVGRLLALHVPDRDAGAQRLQRRRAVVRRVTGSTAAQMQIGALTAFLSYLIQILMSVMMATFMLVMVPRAAVCAERIPEVLDTESSVVPPDRAGHRPARGRADWSCATSRSATRAPSPRCCATSRSVAEPGQTTAIIGSTGAGKTTLLSLIPRLFDATGGAGARRRRRRARARTRGRCGAGSAWCRSGRTCSPARSRATCATATRTRPTTSCGRRCEIAQAGDFVAAMPERARRADRPGRHQRLRRPAAAAGDRPGARAPARDLPVRRLVLGARPRPPTRRLRAALRAGHPARPTVIIVAQRVSTIIDADQIIVLEDGADRRPRPARRAARDLPDVRRDRRVPARAEEAA